MITSVKIKDNTKVPWHYISELEAFSNGTEYNFNAGVNVIIGHNGCGKSTLMNLIANYMFCGESMFSKIPNEAFLFPSIWDNDNNVLDGIDIHADYMSMVFRYFHQSEMDRDSSLASIDNFSSFMNGISSSTGEKGIIALNAVFKAMFGRSDYKFPLDKLLELRNNSNEFWKERVESLLSYYDRNRVELSMNENEFTLLLDEPDRNLDIDNIIQVYGMLSFHKPHMQV